MAIVPFDDDWFVNHSKTSTNESNEKEVSLAGAIVASCVLHLLPVYYFGQVYFDILSLKARALGM